MTRVNLLPPELLTDQHLFAENREIKMVPAALRRSLNSRAKVQVLKSIPSTFTLNTGHVTFFYDKMSFLKQRYLSLYAECIKRGYNLGPSVENLFDLDAMWCSDYNPRHSDKTVSAQRIVDRINMKPKWYKMNGRELSDNWVDMYKEYM